MTFLGVDVAAAAGVFAGSALAILGVLVFLTRRGATGAQDRAQATATPVALLFGNGYVQDATDAAMRVLRIGPHETITWADLRAVFLRRFPGFPTTPPQEAQTLHAGHPDDPADIRLSLEGDCLRLVLTDRNADTADLQMLSDQDAELDVLRAATTAAPHPIWATNADGEVIWGNTAYGRLCEQVGHNAPEASVLGAPQSRDEDAPRTMRCHVMDRSNDKKLWFETMSVPTEVGWMNYATDIAAVVKGEDAQRNFVQTLTKTFAHLPIGLAVFDRNRQLALFNPALIDLTALPADFLSGRPNLLSFFDHLRDGRMMPEPKSYRSWRDQLAELVQAASDDRYSETWSLPNGLTYKITGRPHPNGAIAFLIEDISSEITLTRRFRAELELSHSALDTMDAAVAIFTHLGVLRFANAAYRSLWKSDPDSTFAEMNVLDTSRDWQAACAPSPAWGEIRDFVVQTTERAAWDAEVTMLDGTRLLVSAVPISGGHTMIRFAGIDALLLPIVEPAEDVAPV